MALTKDQIEAEVDRVSALVREYIEVREGREVFVFDGGAESKTVVPVEEYLEILKVARENQTDSTYGIPNQELI